jgi:hypothetical protein
LSFSYSNLLQLAINASLGANPSHEQVVNLLYTNVIGQAPDTATRKVYTDLLDNQTYTVAGLAVLAADTEYNKANVNLVGLAQTGLAYLPFPSRTKNWRAIWFAWQKAQRHCWPENLPSQKQW